MGHDPGLERTVQSKATSGPQLDTASKLTTGCLARMCVARSRHLALCHVNPSLHGDPVRLSSPVSSKVQLPQLWPRARGFLVELEDLRGETQRKPGIKLASKSSVSLRVTFTFVSNS